MIIERRLEDPMFSVCRSGMVRKGWVLQIPLGAHVCVHARGPSRTDPTRRNTRDMYHADHENQGRAVPHRSHDACSDRGTIALFG